MLLLSRCKVFWLSTNILQRLLSTSLHLHCHTIQSYFLPILLVFKFGFFDLHSSFLGKLEDADIKTNTETDNRQINQVRQEANSEEKMLS